MARTIKATDLYELRSVGTVAVSGQHIAYTVTWPDRSTDEVRSTIHLLESDNRVALTESHRDVAPRFSPDGTRLAFLRSEPKGQPQAAVLTIATGQVHVLDGYDEETVHQVDWVDDHRLLIRATQRPDRLKGVDPEEVKRRPLVTRGLDYRANGLGYTVHARRQVSVVALATGEDCQPSERIQPFEPGLAFGHTLLTQPGVDHTAAAVSPDGNAVLVIAADTERSDIEGTNRVWLLATEGGRQQLLTPHAGRWASVGFTADGRPWAAGEPNAAAYGFSRPYLLSPNDPPTVLGPHDVNCVPIIGAAASGKAAAGALFFPGLHAATVSVDRYDDRSGSLTTVAAGPFVITSFDVADNGQRIVAAVTTPTRPAELWEFGPNGHRVLVSLNDELLAELQLAEPAVVSVPSQDGTAIEALVVHPPDLASDGQPGPGLVYVHGGPMSAYTLSFFDEFQMAAADGYTVVAGNPRGSDGHGEAWARSIIGALGTKDWQDVQALTEHLKALPSVDPGRVGIGGGSYGGFMAAWAIGHSDHYEAALVERAVINWETMAGTSDIGSWFLPALLDADWHSGLDALRAMSPISFADNVSTPTLILHAEEDWRCPIEQAEQFFAVLRRNGVDVTMARFPGENHELSRSGSPHHRVERLRLIHDFFADHLLGRQSQV